MLCGVLEKLQVEISLKQETTVVQFYVVVEAAENYNFIFILQHCKKSNKYLNQAVHELALPYILA